MWTARLNGELFQGSVQLISLIQSGSHFELMHLR
jgi:hypothetical protein